MNKLFCYYLSMALIISSCVYSPKVDSAKMVTEHHFTEHDTLNYLALGDSYTIGESVDSAMRWPAQLAQILKDSTGVYVNLQFIAKTGWTTDELNQAIDSSNTHSSYDLVSLLIGVNNQYRGRDIASFIPEFDVLLKRAIHFAGNDTSKVFVVSIPDYGFTPFGEEHQEQISKELALYNHAIDSVANAYKVSYIYITDLSENGLKEPNLVASDGLHPSGDQYNLWVKRIYQYISEI